MPANQQRPQKTLPWLAVGICCAAIMLPAALLAQAAAPAATPTSAAAKPTAAKPLAKPLWAELQAKEQAALKPLAANWDGLSIGQKRKWLTVAKDYERLSPTEQSKLHARMTEWSSLSAQQRAVARQNFAEHKELTDGLTPEQRKAQWQAYQQLSPEEKRKLAESAQKPAVVGAAPAARPQPVLKKEPAPEFGTAKVLAKAKAASSPSGKIAVAPHVQQQGVLLPGNAPEAAKQ